MVLKAPVEPWEEEKQSSFMRSCYSEIIILILPSFDFIDQILNLDFTLKRELKSVRGVEEQKISPASAPKIDKDLALYHPC